MRSLRLASRRLRSVTFRRCRKEGGRQTHWSGLGGGGTTPGKGRGTSGTRSGCGEFGAGVAAPAGFAGFDPLGTMSPSFNCSRQRRVAGARLAAVASGR